MKSSPRHHSRVQLAIAAFAFCASAADAETVTFSFQQGDLQKDGIAHGPGTSYAGAVSGHLVDANTTAVLTTTAAATIGNQFVSSPTGTNGRNFVGLFSYDLTELASFITANTSAASSVAITDVSFKLVAAGASSSGTFHGGISLYRTDPFTTASTWANFDGTNPWTTPFQSGLAETQFRFTGGGSALTLNLGGTSPTTGSKVVGSLLEWTSSANFIAALNTALAQPDKKLHLMAARPLGNADGRVNIHTGSATTVNDRPELVVTLSVNSLSDWTGAAGSSWADAGNWTTPPAAGAAVRFNSSSTANLATVLNQDFTLAGISLINPAGPVSIGGANSLTLGAGGFDLSTATADLTVTTPLVLDATPIWTVANDRTLNVSGAITGSGSLTVIGDGTVSLGASGMLPNGAGAGNLTVEGTLDLNDTSHSVNGLTGAGVIDNSGSGDSVLTVGNNNAAVTFSGVLLNTGSGTLALQKVGSGAMTLTGPSNYAGGFTNDGTGNVIANNNNAFGSGPVVSNAGTIYPTSTRNFSNTLALNNSTLRVGGGGGNSITWSGAVTATGPSGINADGGTGGITLGSTLDIAGATFTSFANGTTNNIAGNISGTGGTLSVTSGTLQLSGTGTYDGTTTLGGSSTLRLQPAGTISSSSNIVINGTGNLNIRNTVGWIYSGTITGEGTGSINLNSGTDAELAGSISGVAAINANTTGTDTTISGIISGTATVNAQGGSILTLSGANHYTGATTVGGGTLVLGAGNVLPDASPVTIGNGTLDAATFTDSAGTLDVTSGAKINLGAGAALAFADSSAVDWTGGSLEITGTFVSGSSLRFGTTAGGLTDDQLLLISATGYTAFDLDSNGFLTASEQLGFAAWQSANDTAGGLGADHDLDGVSNGVEFFLGGTADTTGFTALPGVDDDGGTLSVTWIRSSDYSGTYGTDYWVETSDTLTGTWTQAAPGTGANQADLTTVPGEVKYTFPAGTKNFARLKVTGP
jgi:autotransporter-associated beta strand protein